MSRHGDPEAGRRRGPRRRSGRIRAILSLGIVLGLGGVSTMASWTDSATMTTSPIQSGTLDLRLDGQLSGIGGTYDNATITAVALVPGESLAWTVNVENAGSTNLTYTASATANGPLATGSTIVPVPLATNRLQFSVHPGGSATTTGTQAQSNREGTCSSPSTYSGVLGEASTTVVATARQIARASAENLCIRVQLPSTADNSLQDRTASATFTFNAVQVPPA